MQMGYDPATLERAARDQGQRVNNICCMCLKVITITVFKNTGVCCGNCQKDRDDDHTPAGGMIKP